MDEKNTNSTHAGGITFMGLLQIAFIVLKLCGVIQWSWWVVFIPSMISLAFVVIGILIVVLVAKKLNNDD